ncbi:MAG: hypothetical protein IJS73_01240 [Paludibacteraceae bacterium]|nr:hypothetical protein [Paludibacteraceae bacterium]
MKKVLSIIVLAVMACVFMVGCKEQINTTFVFEFIAGEDLLDFVVPTAEVVNAQNEKITIQLSKSILKDDSEGLVGNPDGKKYLVWEYKIELKGKEHQRDMKISYQKKNDQPTIDNDKQYNMLHSLRSHKEYSNTTYISGDEHNLSLTIGGEGSAITNSNSVNGEDMEEYIKNLVKNPDYKLEAE